MSLQPDIEESSVYLNMNSNERNESTDVTRVEDASLMKKVRFHIIVSLEEFFYRLGVNISKRPWYFIAACFLLTALCSIGLLGFKMENRPDKLWIPWNSEFVHDTDWLRENLPSPIRMHYAIITSENVLDPKVMYVMAELHEKVASIILKQGYSWDDLCFRLPVTKFPGFRKRRDTDDNFKLDFDLTEDLKHENTFKENNDLYDPSLLLGRTYCDILAELDDACWENNPAELWNYNKTAIKALSLGEVIEAVNDNRKSPIFGRPLNYSNDLGGKRFSEDGKIISANAVMIRWFTRINQSSISEGNMKHDLGTGEAVDAVNLSFEAELAQTLKNFLVPSNMSLYFNVARSFGDVSETAIWNDAGMLSVGFTIVFIYVIFMLGKCNLVEQRVILAFSGLTCVGLAILVSYGICSAFSLIYGPVHNILPFLLLGIGIDDMFVIMQCWNNLSPNLLEKPLEERIGLTLKHSGVSVTVTSLTDFFAFAIGATTVLPALQSFCVYAALGIFATYIFQVTLFVSCLVIDQRRLESHRNAFFPCYTHRDFLPNKCSDFSMAKLFFERFFSKWILHTFGKATVCILTLGILAVNTWGNIKLRQEFNPIWFLPQNSYLFKYFMARDTFFSDRGEEGLIVFKNINFTSDAPHLNSVSQSLENYRYICEVESWFTTLKKYTMYNFNKDILDENFTANEFHKYLGRFLYSPAGSKFFGQLKVNGNLTCGLPSPAVLISTIRFKFKRIDNRNLHIKVMNELKGLVASFDPYKEVQGRSRRSFVWSFAFASWETDEIITRELYRNMALAMACVFLATAVLIANLRACIMVFLCVVFTLIDVGGSMHFWGLTIDTVSCVDLVLAIGLCVDYSAHIAHEFMVTKGACTTERAKKSLTNMGPAVLNGGFSTILAFVLLHDSKSHVFITFFKIFFLVVIYGLFHGLVFLPVFLSMLGPPSYSSSLVLRPASRVINKANRSNSEQKCNMQDTKAFLQLEQREKGAT